MEKTTDEAWREIVAQAMRSVIYDLPSDWKSPAIERLVKAGFSLADIRDHWDDLQSGQQPPVAGPSETQAEQNFNEAG